MKWKQETPQTELTRCLNVMTNTVIVENTVYMQAAAEVLRVEGHDEREDFIHLPPARYEHVNRYGKYSLGVEGHPPA